MTVGVVLVGGLARYLEAEHRYYRGPHIRKVVKTVRDNGYARREKPRRYLDGAKKKIVLFCQTPPGAESTGRELRSLLRAHLVSYMAPGKVVVMDALPLNANGKINRQKLKDML